MKSASTIQLLYIFCVIYVVPVVTLILLGIRGNFIFLLPFILLFLVVTIPLNYSWIKSAMQKKETITGKLLLTVHLLGIVFTIIGTIIVLTVN